MGLKKAEIDAQATLLKAHFLGRGWFAPRDVHNVLGMSLRELCGALRCASLHGIPGCTILHDTDAEVPVWIIIKGESLETIQQETKQNKPKKVDWSFLCKPWPLTDLLDSMEEQA